MRRPTLPEAEKAGGDRDPPNVSSRGAPSGAAGARGLSCIPRGWSSQVRAILGLAGEADGRGLDGDAALALELSGSRTWLVISRCEAAFSPRGWLDALAEGYLGYALGLGADAHRAFRLVGHWLSPEHRLDLKTIERWLPALFEPRLTAATLPLSAMLNGAMHWLRTAPPPESTAGGGEGARRGG